jgi:uncharacterized membrane protein YphA (DoxX/SURF4 family)
VSRPIVPTIARILLGLAFTIFGLNFFLHFLPQPELPPAAGQLLGSLVASGWIMTTVKIIEVGSGLLLLSNRFVPLALALLAPVLFNIVAFHAFLDPPMIAVPLVLFVLELYLAWSYRAAFAPMLRSRVSISNAPDSQPAAGALARSAPHLSR